jgi:hypothetical protein
MTDTRPDQRAKFAVGARVLCNGVVLIRWSRSRDSELLPYVLTATPPLTSRSRHLCRRPELGSPCSCSRPERKHSRKGAEVAAELTVHILFSGTLQLQFNGDSVCHEVDDVN